jgi:hypothetical protein
MKEVAAMPRIGILIWFIALSCVFAQEPTTDSAVPAPKGVYVIAFRTPAHVRSSSPEVFHSAAADIRKILAEKGVPLVQDKERGFIENESQMSVENMTLLAKESGAGSLLFITVDRPTSKWIKLILRVYLVDGNQLWEENIDSGMSAMSGASGYKKCFEKLNKVLPKHIGSAGLPAAAEPKQSEVTP